MAIADLSGPLVRRALDRSSHTYGVPDRVQPDVWQGVIGGIDELVAPGSSTGALLGFIERMIFAAALTWGGGALAAAWIGGKVATKWRTWGKIIDEAEYHSYDEYGDRVPLPIGFQLHVRRYVGWLISQRFLIGTGLNILIGIFIYLSGKAIFLIASES